MGQHFVGEIAHIVAEQQEGPRGSSSLSLAERNAEGNLLLLCLDHHKVIDDDPESYSVDRLRAIRNEHYAWVDERLRGERPWKTKLHNFYYLNVPRLNVLGAIAGVSLDLSRYGDIYALHELGWELNGIMLGFQQLLERVELNAIDLDEVISLGPSSRGAIVAFDQEFRTKNITLPEHKSQYLRAMSGDLKKDPHIYTDVRGTRLVATIDPRWITTSTAFVQFRPSGGKGKFAGLALVNSIDEVRKFVSITPLIVGLPSNPFIEEFYSGLAAHTKQAAGAD